MEMYVREKNRLIDMRTMTEFGLDPLLSRTVMHQHTILLTKGKSL